MKFLHIAVAAALAASLGTQAQTLPAANHTVGEVRKVDKEQGKVTLRHGPLQNLDMPAMTMVFRVADPKLLDGVKEGDRVNFTAEKVNGTYTVKSLETAK